ncbi:alpha/beta fold hydrolase [Vitiosangium sp. GDMCC 1.1324]|uniref:alpha/beta fold hydrolase n=1 Tax=Vitiosangium sp. (strain GDMCC 1.1324) TaxID=2138576 RepID=UPI001E5D4D73|nr:alpha/beta hydrolase [Vitiosangium sp. GDMCC 1.1324]
MLAAGAVGACVSRVDTHRGVEHAGPLQPTDAEAFRAARRFADLPFGRIAYVERGSGDAALFLHGAPLNGFQWRGAIDRLSAHRRCVAPDFMGLGYSEVPERQSLAADAQAEMLVALLDALAISQVDIVASDSGGAVAQLFMVRHPERVRTLLLTNCDVEPDSPPPKVQVAIEMAHAGTLADATARWLTDKVLARSTFGAAVYRDPSRFADETIEYYVTPLVSSPLRRAQYHAYHLALEPNPLAGIEAALKRSTVPVRIVWGASDDIFSQADADYLDRTFPRSQGIRRVPGAKLFFQEEFPDIIAEEAQRLWRAG